jgi:hypothetical protein
MTTYSEEIEGMKEEEEQYEGHDDDEEDDDTSMMMLVMVTIYARNIIMNMVTWDR